MEQVGCASKQCHLIVCSHGSVRCCLHISNRPQADVNCDEIDGYKLIDKHSANAPRTECICEITHTD